MRQPPARCANFKCNGQRRKTTSNLFWREIFAVGALRATLEAAESTLFKFAPFDRHFTRLAHLPPRLSRAPSLAAICTRQLVEFELARARIVSHLTSSPQPAPFHNHFFQTNYPHIYSPLAPANSP